MIIGAFSPHGYFWYLPLQHVGMPKFAKLFLTWLLRYDSSLMIDTPSHYDRFISGEVVQTMTHHSSEIIVTIDTYL